MAVLNAKILPARRKSSGKLAIYIALTFKKEVRYISTEFEIDDEYQFQDGKVCYRRDANIMNKRIQYVLDEYRDKLAKLNIRKYFNCSQLKEALLTKDNNIENVTISELFNRRIESLKKENRMTYAKMHEYTLDIILSIINDTPINYLTRNDIKVLESGMIKRGLSPANIQMRMAHFKAALNNAIDEGILRIDMCDHPFRGYTMPASRARVMDVECEDFRKILHCNTSSARIQLAKDLWMLSFYLGGINLADLVRVNLSGNTLSYVRKKTKTKKVGEKETVISIPKEAKQIIDKYIGPEGILKLPYKGSYMNLCCYINKCLKLLAAETNISQKHFSFYSARKTFAQYAFEIGIRTEVIEYCIGQSMKANRPIYNYVRVMQRKADEAIRQVIDYAMNSDLADSRIVNAG